MTRFLAVCLLLIAPCNARDDSALESTFEQIRSILSVKRGDRMQVIELCAEMAKSPNRSIAFLKEKSRSRDLLTQRAAVLAAMLFYPLANKPSPLTADEVDNLNRVLTEHVDTLAWVGKHPEGRAASDLLLSLPKREKRTQKSIPETK